MSSEGATEGRRCGELDTYTLAGIGILVFVMMVLAVLFTDGGTRSMALRGLRRKGRTAWLTIMALAVGTAVIFSSLAVGDALRSFVVQKAEANLNGVDAVVLSADLFDADLVEAIRSDSRWDDHFDVIEPAIVTPIIVHNPISGRTVARGTLYGLRSDMGTDLGKFHWHGGSGIPLEDGKLVVNREMARELDAYRHQTITLKLDDPSIKKETIFTEGGVEELDIEVVQVVDDTGLGRLQLSVQDVQPAAFATLGTVSEALGLRYSGNAMLLSLADDASSDKALSWLEDTIDGLLTYRDIHLDMHQTDGGEWRIVSDRIFLDDDVLPVLEVAPHVSPVSVYFVDSLTGVGSGNGEDLSYSTVAGIDPQLDSHFGLFRDNATGKEVVGDIGPGETILTNWTADILGLKAGDHVKVGYSVVDDHFNMVSFGEEFEVALVVDMVGKGFDSGLMPEYPGISSITSCFDWEPPFDIDLSTIGPEDEGYWVQFGGTPKAFIHIDDAKRMWGTDQGNYTMVKLDGLTRAQIEERLAIVSNAQGLGMVLVPIRERLLASASAMDIFLEMFISFGTITVIAGMVFVASTFMMMLRERRNEIGTMLSVGISRGSLFRFLFAEGLVYSFVAVFVGLLFGWLAAAGLLVGLETVWSNIVGGQSIVEQALSTSYLTVGSTMLSIGAGLLLSFMTLLVLAWKASSSSVMEARGHEDLEAKGRGWRMVGYMMLVIGLCLVAASFYLKDMPGMFGLLGTKGVVLVLWSMAMTVVFKEKGQRGPVKALAYGAAAFVVAVVGAVVAFNDPPFSTLGLFVSEGLFMTIALFGIFVPVIWLLPRGTAGTSSALALSFLRKEPRRTAMTVAVFALIIFSIVSLAVIVDVQERSLETKSVEQGGGFDIMAEATTELEMDLRTEASRRDAGVNLSYAADIIQLKTVGTSGAVCSNMNPQYPPRLIGVDNTFARVNRLELDSTLSGNEGPEAWEDLDDMVRGRVPIFVDENTLIIYIGYEAYAGALGHVFDVETETGRWQLEVVGILAPSVVAGSFIMHERFLEQMYPTASGYRLLFIDTDKGHRGAVISELEAGLADHGLDARTVSDIVGENVHAEQGYMGLFQAYLGAGLIIGIVALSVTEIRAVEERRKEIGMLRAVGIERSTVARMFYTEAFLVGSLSLVIGIIGGLVLAVTSGPVWGDAGIISFPVTFLALFAVVLMAMVLLSTVLPASKASRLAPAVLLKEE